MESMNLPDGGLSLAGFGQAIAWCVTYLLRGHSIMGIAVGIILVCLLIVVVVRMARRRRPTSRVAGFARVLSVETITTTEGSDLRHACRIALRVEIPGLPPYDATSSNGDFMTAAEITAVQPGQTVTVDIDSTNPQDVWIDFSSIT
jgi:hypothetical protein